MVNNDILKRLRVAFDMDDQKLVEIFLLADHQVSIEKLRSWLTKEVDPKYTPLGDKQLAIFLNGFITEKRGQKKGMQVEPENRLNNNIILKKLKIALALKTEDVLDLFALVDKPITANELSDFLRNPKQEKFRPMMDQYLRHFLQGLRAKYRKQKEIK